MMPLKAHEPLAPYTTFHIGGPAEWFSVVTDCVQLGELIQQAGERDLPITVLGGGSNVLISDQGISGIVVQMAIGGSAYTETQGGVVLVRVGAGVEFDALVAETVARGLWGLENLSSIPGTVGATPIQNVGAYGVEVAELVVEVEAIHRLTGERRIFTTAQCQFGYRTSFFKTPAGAPYIVTEVTFALSLAPRPRLTYADLARWAEARTDISLNAIREAVVKIRADKFPDWHHEGTAGSFFKNPVITTEEAEQLRREYPDVPLYVAGEGKVKCALGFILDRVCGLRGYREGAVRLYEKQALVLVADRGAQASDVKKFAVFVSKSVKEKTGIAIEWEVTTL